MSAISPEHEGVSLVLLGSFNPAIYSPEWLFARGLVSERERDTATIDIVSKQISQFSVADMVLVADQDKFILRTATIDRLMQVRDIAVGIFGLLDQTPITAGGMNRDMHFASPSTETWHRIGHTLAPKDLWSGLIERPGLSSLKIEGFRAEREVGVLRIQVQPSKVIHPGVHIQVNDHIPQQDDMSVAETIGKLWEDSQRYARHLGIDLLARCMKEVDK